MNWKRKEVLRESVKTIRSAGVVVVAVAGRAQDIKSKVVRTGLRKALKKRAKIRMTTKANPTVGRGHVGPGEANERAEAAEASVVGEITRSTETQATDNMMKRKRHTKVGQMIRAARAVR